MNSIEIFGNHKIKRGLDIKEIRIDYNSGFSAPHYSSTLRISKHWISYKKYKYDKCLSAWDYKTDSREFEKDFEKVLENIRTVEFIRLPVFDRPTIKITIRYIDESIDSFEAETDSFKYSSKNETASYVKYLILRLIPRYEEIPEYLENQTIDDLDFEVVDDAFEYLLSKPKVKYSTSNPPEPGLVSFAYPEYDPRIERFLFMFEPAYDYIPNKAELMTYCAIEELTFDDIRLLMTYVFRGERFCDGHIAHFIENGQLLKWVERLIELKKDFEGL